MQRFIDDNAGWRALALLLVVALLPACSFVPKKTMESTAAAPAAAGVTDPYLRDRPAVSTSVQADFDAAVAAMQAGRWQQAEPALQQLAGREPKLSGPLLNLALLYAQTQKPEQAEIFFQRAIVVNPNNLVARNQYGIWLREQGRFHDAEAVYRQAPTQWTDFPDTHLNLGILYELYLGRLPEALQHYQRYLELHGEDSPVKGWVADLQRRLPADG